MSLNSMVESHCYIVYLHFWPGHKTEYEWKNLQNLASFEIIIFVAHCVKFLQENHEKIVKFKGLLR